MCTRQLPATLCLAPKKYWDTHDVTRILSLNGEYDPANTPQLRESIEALIQQSRGDLVLDMSGVTFMDASMIRVLVTTRALLEMQSRRLTVRRPSPCTIRLLTICGMSSLVEGDHVQNRAHTIRP